ncbi:Protein TRM32 [Bienertia sinuspersici]
MIAKEVTKRRGRHRRSSTCPANSELGRSSLSDQHMENKEEGILKESKDAKNPKQVVDDEGDKTCGLCCTSNIECQLNSTLIENDENQDQVDKMNYHLENVPNNRLPFKGKIDRCASLHHSRDFLDTMDVLSTNKQIFLRVPDDDDHDLSQESRSSNKNALTKSGTFPNNKDPSCTKDSSFPGLFKLNKQKSHLNNSQQSRVENPSNSRGNQIVGRRFKDLRQKIKHLIKENRKERRRIAMDAVLHKVPFGHKVTEEDTKESPCVSVCETDSSVSPYRTKGNKCYRRRSPSLDESMDKYCQLFQTTSFSSREPKMSTPQSSRLRVMDENSCRKQQKGLARIFSSPNLDTYSSNQSEDYDRHISSKTPNRNIVSFSERKVEGVSNIYMESRMQFDANKDTSKDLEESVDVSNTKAISSVENDVENSTVEQGDTTVALEVDFYDNNDGITSTQSTESILGSRPQLNSYEHDGALLEESDGEQAEESPTLSYTIVDEDAENSLIHSTSPKHHHIQVRSNEIEEFNYVRDILQLSGYSGDQLLGTWYSSEQPVDPSVFIELESFSLVEPQCSSLSTSKEGNHINNLLLFDVINEVLLGIYEKSVSYWSTPLCSCSQTHPMPKGYHVLEEVWSCINWYSDCSKSELDLSLDYITTRDLAKYDGWMNLQFDAECVGLELEDSIFDDLLTELVP